MLNLIQKLTKLLNTEVTQFRQITIFQRFLYTKTLKMLSVYYRKASDGISTSGKHSDTKYRQCQCREALDCILTGGKQRDTKVAIHIVSLNAVRHEIA